MSPESSASAYNIIQRAYMDMANMQPDKLIHQQRIMQTSTLVGENYIAMSDYMSVSYDYYFSCHPGNNMLDMSVDGQGEAVQQKVV